MVDNVAPAHENFEMEIYVDGLCVQEPDATTVIRFELHCKTGIILLLMKVFGGNQKPFDIQIH